MGRISRRKIRHLPGVRFTYPFITDFISAMFVRAGASLRNSMFIENYIIAVALVGVLHRFGQRLVRNRTAAIITPLLILLNGGFGWGMLLGRCEEDRRRCVSSAQAHSALVHDSSGNRKGMALGQRDHKSAGNAARISARHSVGGDCVYAVVDCRCEGEEVRSHAKRQAGRASKKAR